MKLFKILHILILILTINLFIFLLSNSCAFPLNNPEAIRLSKNKKDVIIVGRVNIQKTLQYKRLFCKKDYILILNNYLIKFKDKIDIKKFDGYLVEVKAVPQKKFLFGITIRILSE